MLLALLFLSEEKESVHLLHKSYSFFYSMLQRKNAACPKYNLRELLTLFPLTLSFINYHFPVKRFRTKKKIKKNEFKSSTVLVSYFCFETTIGTDCITNLYEDRQPVPALIR